MRSFFVSLMALLTGATGAIASASAHDANTKAHFLANEAVLVAHGDEKVLFDAFYSHSYGALLLVPEDIRNALMAGTPPYDGVDALFVSHVHGDHFSAEPALAYLRAQPVVQFFGPREAVDALKALVNDPDDPLLTRLVPFDIRPVDPPVATTAGALTIDVAAVPHAGAQFKDVRNLVFRVSLGDWPTVMHLGDAGANDDAFAAHEAHWDARITDTAFPPHWLANTDVGKEILRARIKPHEVIAIHIPAAAVGKGDSWRNRLGTDAFTDPGEWREIQKPE
jgi:L-ascorbate metabolism protein UlaG (beta-lactamase superfamily)